MQAVQYIGSLEQLHLDVRCPDGGEGGSTALAFTHEELGTGSMLSVVASLTPYSDYNQSPRNMYQCQMGKQTMGTPAQALPHRTDTKLYRLQTPQTPIARTDKYDTFHMDEFPSGTNAVVAVLAYTGYADPNPLHTPLYSTLSPFLQLLHASMHTEIRNAYGSRLMGTSHMRTWINSYKARVICKSTHYHIVGGWSC
jgi:hypothetical protein